MVSRPPVDLASADQFKGRPYRIKAGADPFWFNYGVPDVDAGADVVRYVPSLVVFKVAFTLEA